MATRRIVRAVRRRLQLARFNSRLLSRGVHAVAIGDSHAEVFRYVDIPGVELDLHMIEGTTASGLENPNSKTQALPLFRERIRHAKRWHPVVSLLGEVDCGFVIWYRAQKYGTSVDTELEHALSSYATFLGEIAARGHHVVVVSPPPPTIVDFQTWGEVANARREVTATQHERTELTLRFAEGLRAFGYPLLDATTPLLDPATGLIDERFRNPDPLDHHLNFAEYAPVVAAGLAPLLPGLRPRP